MPPRGRKALKPANITQSTISEPKNQKVCIFSFYFIFQRKKTEERDENEEVAAEPEEETKNWHEVLEKALTVKQHVCTPTF